MKINNNKKYYHYDIIYHIFFNIITINKANIIYLYNYLLSILNKFDT